MAGAAAESDDGVNGRYIEDLEVGMTAELTKQVSEEDIVQFAAVTGDDNPVHLDQGYAAGTPFRGRIAHGMLSAGLISAVLGTRLPGPGCIYLSQSLKFRAPVRIDDTVVTRVTVSDVIPDKNRVTLATVCTVDDKVVVEGEALVRVPSRAA